MSITRTLSVITPLNPRRRVRSRRRHVLRIRLVIAAEPSRGFHALLKARKAAVRPAATSSAVIVRAPRIILSLGARSNADDTDANSQHEQQEPHSRLVGWPLSYKCLLSRFIPYPRAMRHQ